MTCIVILILQPKAGLEADPRQKQSDLIIWMIYFTCPNLHIWRPTKHSQDSFSSQRFESFQQCIFIFSRQEYGLDMITCELRFILATRPFEMVVNDSRNVHKCCMVFFEAAFFKYYHIPGTAADLTSSSFVLLWVYDYSFRLNLSHNHVQTAYWAYFACAILYRLFVDCQFAYK